MPMLSDAFTHARIEVFRRECLLENCGGAERARDIVADFLNTVPQVLDRLAQAVASGDAARAQREAHSLQGCAQTLGAEGLAWVSLDLAETARRGRLFQAPALLCQIEGEFERVHPRLKEYLRAA